MASPFSLGLDETPRCATIHERNGASRPVPQEPDGLRGSLFSTSAMESVKCCAMPGNEDSGRTK